LGGKFGIGINEEAFAFKVIVFVVTIFVHPVKTVEIPMNEEGSEI
jgi:hypothetical protein